MKIIADRQTFATALNDVMPFIPAKPAIQIFRYAKITVKGNRLKVEASNAQDTILRYIDIIGSDEDGSFLVNMTDFGKYIAAVKGDTIEITVNGTEINVRHSKGTADFSTESAEQFPVAQKNETEEKRISINPKVLSDCIENAMPFVATETIRPVMCGIYASIEDNKFCYCGSDTHKLIAGETLLDREYENVSFLIMPTAFKSILRMCKNSESITISITPKVVSYASSDTVLYTVQSAGSFPLYRRVIPKTSNMECTVDRDEIADTVKRVSMFCTVSRCLKVELGMMSLTITADNLSFGKKSTEDVIHGGCDGEITIGLQADYLLTVLSIFGRGPVKMSFTDEAHPVVLTQDLKQGVTAILMPMSLINE